MHEMNLNKSDASIASRGKQVFQLVPSDEPRKGIYGLPVSEVGQTEEEFELYRTVVLGYN